VLFRPLATVIAALLALSPAAAAAKPSKDKLKKARIAVLDFPAAPGALGCGVWKNNERRMAGVLRDLFTTEVSESADGRVRIVERERIDDVRGELKFQQSGEVDGATAQKVGKLLGVRYMLTGKITRFSCKQSGAKTGWGLGALVGKATGSSMAGRVAGSASTKSVSFEGRLDVRLVDTQTGEVLGTFKDEEETSDTSVKIAGGGNDVEYDDGLASQVFEPIAERLAPKIVKKLVAVHEENLEDEQEDAADGEDDEAATARKAGGKVAAAGGGGPDEDGSAGAGTPSESSDGAGASGPAAGEVYGNKFDFVPGEKVLYFDDFSDTDPGDYPSRWTNAGRGGAVEVVEWEGKHWLKGLADQGDGRYRDSDNFLRVDLGKALPEKFTVELDIPRTSTIGIVFTSKYWVSGQPYMRVSPGKAQVGSTVGSYADDGKGQTRHVSIAISKTNAKLYVDGERVTINPDFRPEKYVFRTVGVQLSVVAGRRSDLMFTNFKLAEGGKDYAKDLAVSGRIVTHGITFDSGSDRMRPESGPTLAKILKLLKDDAALAFDIEGHTDSQGGDQVNLLLSQRRAAVVKAWLVSQGIEDGRLASKGVGSSKPLDTNDTPEGRANNRRVEFAKR
jgi:outer membrane protein OmpA-like peptidoglycan-associated protein/curli biogenesis system outer membrane secretion channel CsgG